MRVIALRVLEHLGNRYYPTVFCFPTLAVRVILSAVMLVGGSTQTVAQTWTPVAPWPSPRVSFGAASSNGSIYAVGGYSYSIGGFLAAIYSAQTDVYDTTTNTWRTVAPMPTRRAFLSVVAALD